MKLDNLPDIDPSFYDPNYVVCMNDVMSTLVCKEGYCVNADERLLNSILLLMGMDINRPIYRTELENGAAVRSQITGQLQQGGVIFQGYQRTDDTWKKQGLKITESYLFGSKSGLLIDMIKDKV